MFKQNSSKSNASHSLDDIPTLSINTAVETNLAPMTSRSSSRESPFKISSQLSLFTDRFNPKNDNGEFLGETSEQRDSLQYCQFIQTSSMARSKFEFEEKGALVHGRPVQSLEPTPHAIARTKRAVSDFFSLAYHVLDKNNEQFPLAGKNKCLGIVAVPESKLVMIAISQDKNPAADDALRSQMVDLLDRINHEESNTWVFELACIPTKSQYMMPRTLFMRTIHPAPEEWVKPHTRCVEVALMVALNKIRRNITPENASVMAFGGTLWAIPWRLENSAAAPHFEGAKRNITYVTQPSISVDLGHGVKGWVDIWDPCKVHCAIYKDRMNAIGASGGPATSFTEPRSERHLPPRIQEQAAAMLSPPK